MSTLITTTTNTLQIPSESTYFINPTPTNSTSARNFEKSTSLIERPVAEKKASIAQLQTEMSYRPSELSTISRHLSENNVSAPTKQNYEDLVSCPVCFDVFENSNESKLPKILPCQHTYCTECIKSLMHCSNDNSFNCPHCKYKIENLTDASNLPTSRIVLTLLEKDSLNYQGYASCPSCRQIRSLEVCFECNLPLCAQCVNKHFEAWKNEISDSCLKAEEVLEGYKMKIDHINPLITKNFETVQSIKTEIEDSFNQLIQRLNTEKEVLLKSVNEIKDENTKYINFKKETAALIASLKVFRETNEGFEKKLMMSRMKKCQQNFDLVQKMQRSYIDLVNPKFKLLERFEKNVLPDIDYNIAGNLIISEIDFENNRNKSNSNKQQAPVLTQNGMVKSISAPKFKPVVEHVHKNLTAAEFTDSSTNIPSAPRESIAKQNILENTNNDTVFKKWMMNSQVNPQAEITIPYLPSFLCSFDNLLFVMDNTSFLSIYEKVYSAELKLRNSTKLDVPNVKSIAVNNSYFAVAYAGLKKEQLKKNFKNMPLSGIILYRREQHVVCTVYDKTIDLSKKEVFKNVSSIVLNEKNLFACDLEMRSIYQFDIKTGNLINSFEIPDGQPANLSLNKNYLIATDSKNSTLYAFNVENLSFMTSVNLKDIDQVNGIFNSLLTDDNHIFIKNADSQVCLLDNEFNPRAFYNQIQAKILSLSMIKDNTNQMLIIGTVNSKQQHKLFGYLV